MNFLERILDHKRREVADRKRRTPLDAMPPGPLPQAGAFASALRGEGLSVIPEIKRQSPSRGRIVECLDVAGRARQYAQGGAAAISVLTDEHFFGAVPDDVGQARAAAQRPVLRKDFILDPYQVHESRAMGADAVLLIVAALEQGELTTLLGLAAERQLEALVEVHTDEELARAVDAGAGIIGINNRDLRTFSVDLKRGLRLHEKVPGHCLTVAESGIRTAADAAAVRRAGFDGVLIGEALMGSADPAGFIRGIRSLDSATHPASQARPAYGHSP